MTRRKRLMASLRGEPVDRPAACFYELNGLDQNPADPDPFNIFSHPSWEPLLKLTKERSDCIPRRSPSFKNAPPDPMEELTTRETRIVDGSRLTTKTIKIGKRILTERTRRDPDVDTVWTTEHLLKDVDDLKAFLGVPIQDDVGQLDPSPVLEAERALGDDGIILIDSGDPICSAASLFDMGTYTTIAFTERELFHQLLQRFAKIYWRRTEITAAALPGRLWRICGPEYASPPYLPPSLFKEYAADYDKPMVDSIQKHGGFARIHSHGRLRDILDHIVGTGCAALDPIEPPPQGDVELSYVREKYGKQLTLFGNLEISDIENLPTKEFAKKVRRAIHEGTSGEGRGFVLMPSACPYGRILPELTLRNYETIIECVSR